MTLWMVRAGSHGEQETTALENNVVTIGWNEFGDMSNIKSKEQLEKKYNKIYPGAKKMTIANEVGQLWRFIHEIQIGDLVALPLKFQATIAIGEIKSKYKYKKLAENVIHFRKVKWLKYIPRSAFDQDLLYSLGAFMTVCQISRNNAEERILSLLKKDSYEELEEEYIDEERIDIETSARDEIIKHIGRKFKGHDLARLMNAILIAQGYTTRISPPGPDGGVDILASSGPLGFESPRICVQVKSTSSPADVNILRELWGTMSKVNADQGMLVSWSGFNKNALKESKDDFFRTRLWDSGDIIEAILKHYDRFDDELKAEIPLKKIWALVLEEE